MARKTQSVLPSELLDSVFSFLHNDHPSLRSCAEVSHRFSELVERHIYREITVAHYESSGDLNAFSPSHISKLLADKPRLVSLVRSLRVVMVPADASRIYASDESIGRTICLFSGLTEFSLVASNTYRISWDTFHMVLQTSFVQILRLPSLESVAIKFIQHFPLRLLGYCISLKSLTLHQVEHTHLNLPLTLASIPSSTGALSRLQRLEISLTVSSDFTTMISWLISKQSPSIKNLHILRIELGPINSISLFRPLLNAEFVHSLQHLHIETGIRVTTTYKIDANSQIHRTGSPTSNEVWDLSSLHNLQSLTIAAIIMSSYSPKVHGMMDFYLLYIPLPWITQLLQKPSPPLTRLSRIVLKLAFAPKMHVFLLERIDWKPLVDTLRALSQDYALRDVEFKLMWNARRTDIDVQDIISKLQDNRHLASLIESNILTIYTSDF
ncbi:hypothetical protein CVT25_012508 [Psilocybe cyanescens]|uniref:F-box domain-containing protein n=1 Tax=Psilocybe cyanescens TaxID=93625 RepID=A0A409W4W2_PSICY|nr:hypothetical protein CVT25_012508 [Psilocybe cyanescens]